MLNSGSKAAASSEQRPLHSSQGVIAIAINHISCIDHHECFKEGIVSSFNGDFSISFVFRIAYK